MCAEGEAAVKGSRHRWPTSARHPMCCEACGARRRPAGKRSWLYFWESRHHPLFGREHWSSSVPPCRPSLGRSRNEDERRIPIEVLYCGLHDVAALSVGTRRVTSMKCCGQWRVERRFWVKRADLTEAIEQHRAEDPLPTERG